MRRVIIESPFRGTTPDEEARFVAYARQAMLDSLMRGEAPMLSHLLYTQVLDDKKPGDRTLGIDAGLAWGQVADATIVYADLGVTSGMHIGIGRAEREKRPIERRFILV